MPDRIMYICEVCADNNPEGCGHLDRAEVRVLPDGRWLCDGCYDDEAPADAQPWSKLPAVPEYVPRNANAHV